MYYYAYDTQKGRNIFIEDFFVMESHRGTGVGTMMFNRLIEVYLELRDHTCNINHRDRTVAKKYFAR